MMITRMERLGLQRRIMLYVCGGLILVMAVYGAVSVQAVAQSTNLVFRERLLVAETAARQLDGDLADLQQELNSIRGPVAASLGGGDPTQALPALEGLRAHWSADGVCGEMCAVLVADPSGQVLVSDPSGAQLSDLASLPAIRNAVGGSQPTVNDAFAADLAGRGLLILADPATASGKVTAVLVAELGLADISQRFEPPLQPTKVDYGLELLDANGVVLASTQSQARWQISEHYSLVKDMLRSGQSGTATHAMPAGASESTHIIAFVPLETAPWGVVVEEPQDVALALPRMLQNRLLAFGAIALLAGLGLAWLTTRAVVRPINVLIDATQRLAAGDLEQPLDLAAEDEVGRLARSFDEMRVELKQSRAEIARWNRELETRVSQRTRELSALVQSSQALAETLELDPLFEILIKETRGVMPAADAMAVFLYDPGREVLVARSAFGLSAAESARLAFRVGEGIAGRSFQSQSPLRLDGAEAVGAAQSNLSAENRASFVGASGGRQVQSALGAPLISEGARLGALVLYNFTRTAAFTGNDVTVLQAFANQAASAIQNARLYAALQQKEAARAALLEQTIQAQEEERARVAREIHDELGQLLTRLSIDLKLCESQIKVEPQQAAETLARTQALVWQTIEQAHRMIVALRPAVLDELGLQAALREELSTRLAPLGVNTMLEGSTGAGRLPPLVEITVFRVAQEAISNIARHAHAGNVVLRLHAGETLELSIEDDGQGLPADWRGGRNGHRPLGLLGMQERAALVGGTLAFEPRLPKGTRVLLRVPLEQAAAKNRESA